MIKCIVCDLDGTLIKKDDTIEEKTYQALKEYMKQGIEFIVATGRDYNMVIDFLNDYDLDCDLILNNGTQYCHAGQKENEIYPMDNQSFLKIAHILDDYGYLLAIHTDHGKYSFMDDETFWNYHIKLLTDRVPLKDLPKKTFTTKEGYLRDFHYVKQPEDILDQGIKVLKIDARHHDPIMVKGIKEKLNIEHLDISSSYEENIEITTNISNKGKLLKKVIEDKGLHEDEVAVFGDGENDSFMLHTFPYSFAPANANPIAKECAHFHLTTTCDEGAVFEGFKILKELKIL